MHALEAGPADRSHGVAVAQLAGVPAAVIKQAQNTLAELQNRRQTAQTQNALDLFAAVPDAEQAAPSAAEAALAALNPDALSPREALDALYQLKKLV